MFLSYLCKDHITFSMQLIKKPSWEDSDQLYLVGERGWCTVTAPWHFRILFQVEMYIITMAISQEAVGLKIAVLTLTWSRSYSSIKISSRVVCTANSEKHFSEGSQKVLTNHFFQEQWSVQHTPKIP